jgi:hypothetical protein
MLTADAGSRETRTTNDMMDPTPPEEPQLRAEPERIRWFGWRTWLPIVMVGVYGLLLIFKRTRPWAVRMADENHPIELATFAFLLIGGIMGVRLAARLRRMSGAKRWALFYAVFSLLLLLVAMEEISWGQWFFHFHTPEAISRINTQHEFNLHNLRGMGGHTEYLRVTFGVGGLVGLALWTVRSLRPIAVPPALWAWFIIITVFAAADLYCDVMVLDNNISKALDVMSEIIELLIAIVAVLYLRLHGRAARIG